MKQLIFLTVFLLSLFSCNSQELIIGEYIDTTFDSEHDLKINADTTFYYFWKTGLIGGEVEGTWKIEKNKLILNSYMTISEIQSFYESLECDTCSVGINLKVIDFKSDFGLQGASLTVFKNGNIILDLTTDKNGNAIIIDQEIDSLIVDFVGYNSFTYKPSDNDNKLIVINMKLEELSRNVLLNEKWKIEKDKLISPNGLVLIKK